MTVLLCAAALCLYGCEENCDCSSEGKNISDNSGDVSELISDDYFRQYCLRTFDTNYDGKLSQSEADAVKQIVVTSPTGSNSGGLEVDFSGIEHFKNLEYFESNLAVGIVDMSQNTKLTRILLSGSAVEEVDLRNTNMTTVNERAFYTCSSLASIDLPEGVTSIGESAFGYCSSLADVTVRALTPPYGNSAFGGIKSDAVLYVTAQSIDLYKEATGWKYFSDIRAIEE